VKQEMTKKTTISISNETHKRLVQHEGVLEAKGGKKKTHDEAIENLFVSLDQVKPIVKRLRETIEEEKKHPAKFNAYGIPLTPNAEKCIQNLTEIVNSLEKLSDLPISVWSKDDDGFPVLTQKGENNE
jgi:malonyl CoA-acyl carrier protein transacylase